jgi:hypothetical protein
VNPKPQPAKAHPKSVTKRSSPKLGTQSKMQKICEQGESQCSQDTCLPQQAGAGAEASGRRALKTVKGNDKEIEWEEEAAKASNKSVGKAAQRTCAGKEAAPARKTRGGAEGAGGSVSVSSECKECNAKWLEKLHVTECLTCMGCVVEPGPTKSSKQPKQGPAPVTAPAAKRAKKGQGAELLAESHLGCCACVVCTQCGEKYPTKLSPYVRNSANLWQANEGFYGGCKACCPQDFRDVLDHPESGSEFPEHEQNSIEY